MSANLLSAVRSLKSLPARPLGWVLAAAAAAAPSTALAGHYDRDYHDRDYREHREYRDRDHGRGVKIEVDIHKDRDRCEPVYEERETRVWVEPVYKTVCDR